MTETIPKYGELDQFHGDIDQMVRSFEQDDQVSYSVLWDVPDESRNTSDNSNNSTKTTLLMNQFKKC